MNKEYILNEIKRTAEKNNGLPLGRRRFYLETGIKESDWMGKIWVKWSDATKEAGYGTNKMTEAISDEILLDKYISFVQEIGHIPTVPELRIKSSKNNDFPNHNTFTKYGTKKDLILKALEYSRKNIKYQAGTIILQSGIDAIKSIENKTEINSENGYVYLIKFGDEYKIGSSNDVERRFREIKTQMPYEGKIIHTINTGDPDGIELYWHNYFKDKRLKGEWFKLSLKDISYFKKRKLM